MRGAIDGVDFGVVQVVGVGANRTYRTNETYMARDRPYTGQSQGLPLTSHQSPLTSHVRTCCKLVLTELVRLSGIH